MNSQQNHCPRCRMVIAPNSSFCTNCGQQFVVNNPNPSLQANEAMPQQPSADINPSSSSQPFVPHIQPPPTNMPPNNQQPSNPQQFQQPPNPINANQPHSPPIQAGHYNTPTSNYSPQQQGQYNQQLSNPQQFQQPQYNYPQGTPQQPIYNYQPINNKPSKNKNKLILFCGLGAIFVLILASLLIIVSSDSATVKSLEKMDLECRKFSELDDEVQSSIINDSSINDSEEVKSFNKEFYNQAFLCAPEGEYDNDADFDAAAVISAVNFDAIILYIRQNIVVELNENIERLDSIDFQAETYRDICESEFDEIKEFVEEFQNDPALLDVFSDSVMVEDLVITPEAYNFNLTEELEKADIEYSEVPEVNFCD